MGTPAAGRITTLSIATALIPSVVFTAISGSRDLNLTLNRETIDVTSRDSAGWKQFISGDATAGISGDVVYQEDDLGQQELTNLVFSGVPTKVRFRPLGLATGNDEYEADCIVTKADISSPVSGEMSMAFEFKISGAPTLVLQP